eukprot:EG_transcript_11847
MPIAEDIVRITPSMTRGSASSTSALDAEERERCLAACERQLDAIERHLPLLEGSRGGSPSASIKTASHRPLSSPHGGDVEYPQPSAAWLEEVRQLQAKVARLKAREQELNQRQKHRHENMQLASADVPDLLTAKFLEVESSLAESRRGVIAQHGELVAKDMHALAFISNERCNALNKLFELKLERVGDAPLRRQPQSGSPDYLEKRILDLEEDNYALRRRLQDEDGRRSARELELKNICIEQAKEIEDLRQLLGGGPGRAGAAEAPADGLWSGIEVADIQLSEEKRQAILDTHSHGVVRITKVGGQALRAGLKVGDVVTWVNTAHRTVDAGDFHNAMSKMRLGDAATLMIRRGRTEKEVTLVCE